MGSKQQPPSLHTDRSDFLIGGLHLLVLWNFAVAQPLFDLFSRSAEFFVLRQSPPADIVLFVLLLSFVLPALGVLVLRGLRAVHVEFSVWVHLFLVGSLSAMLALQILKIFQTPPNMSGFTLMLVAGGIGVLTSVVYRAYRPVRTFFTLLSPSLLIIPVLFLFFSPVSDLLFPKPVDVAALKIKDPPPIVLVVFDELSSIALMDGNLHIDSRRYPHFAAFARQATWFRNASTVSGWTPQAVPAILTGNYPSLNQLPTAAGHPKNLFTLLGGTYAFSVHGTITELCPQDLCDQLREPWRNRIEVLLSDVSIVYLHILLPDDQVSNLPSLRARWGNFAGGPAPPQQDGDNDIPTRLWQSIQTALLAELGHERPQVFHNFLDAIQPTDKATLYYLHTLLPHSPYEYLPTGQAYSADGGDLGLKEEVWVSDEWTVTQSYQRYLLQVGYVDTLLGRLVARLKSTGLYEKALMVITADHGVSFRPNDSRRLISSTNFADILSVPLFIKAPFQQRSEILDQNFETVDILPTLAELLEVELPWPVEGHSAYASAPPDKGKFFDPSRRFGFDRFVKAMQATVKKQANLFPYDAPPLPDPESSNLVGQSVKNLSLRDDPDLAIQVDQSTLMSQVDLEGHFLPAHITGTLYSKEPRLIALALNGKVQTLTRPWPFAVKGRYGKWSALIDHRLLRSGKNDLEAFAVVMKKGQATLVRAAGSPQSLPEFQPLTDQLLSPTQQEVLVTSNGERHPLTPLALDGWVDHAVRTNESLEVAGWAADVRDGQPAKEIWVVVNGERVHTGRFNIARPDVVQNFRNSALQQSGFHYKLPLTRFKESPSIAVRLFAVAEDSSISELNYAPALRGDESSHPVILLTR